MFDWASADAAFTIKRLSNKSFRIVFIVDLIVLMGSSGFFETEKFPDREFTPQPKPRLWIEVIANELLQITEVQVAIGHYRNSPGWIFHILDGRHYPANFFKTRRIRFY